jgi:hypothetical protein
MLNTRFYTAVKLFFFMPPAARNLFIKRFLDFQKFFIKVFLYYFLRVSSQPIKIDGGF